MGLIVIPDLRTDPALLARIRAATRRDLAPDEIRAQRISFAASCSDLPRDEVIRIVDRMNGASS